MDKKQTSIYLDSETLNKLCKLAKLKKLSRSSLVRTMINEVDCGQDNRRPSTERPAEAAKS
jgi:predicted transcriptional regulator